MSIFFSKANVLLWNIYTHMFGNVWLCISPLKAIFWLKLFKNFLYKPRNSIFFYMYKILLNSINSSVYMLVYIFFVNLTKKQQQQNVKNPNKKH